MLISQREERICRLKYVKASSERTFAYTIETKTKLLPRRIFGEGTTSGFEIDSISRLDLVIEGTREMKIFSTTERGILQLVWRYRDAIRIDWNKVLYLSESFPRSKINRTGDARVAVRINYQSIIHRVPWLNVNCDPKEWARNDVWCFRKLELESSIFQTRPFTSLPPPLCFPNIGRATSPARKQEFDSLFCLPNPWIYSTHF